MVTITATRPGSLTDTETSLVVLETRDAAEAFLDKIMGLNWGDPTVIAKREEGVITIDTNIPGIPTTRIATYAITNED